MLGGYLKRREEIYGTTYDLKYIYIQERTNIFLNEQRNKDAAAKKGTNTSGVGKSNHYYEDIYIYLLTTTPTNHRHLYILTTSIDSTH